LRVPDKGALDPIASSQSGMGIAKRNSVPYFQEIDKGGHFAAWRPAGTLHCRASSGVSVTALTRSGGKSQTNPRVRPHPREVRSMTAKSTNDPARTGVQLLDTGHVALETHADEITLAMGPFPAKTSQ
jgi:hypothetical protein